VDFGLPADAILVIFRIEEELLCIMRGTEFQVRTLSFASGGFHISTKNSYPGSSGTSVVVCGQSMVILTFCEGGLLCAEN